MTGSLGCFRTRIRWRSAVPLLLVVHKGPPRNPSYRRRAPKDFEFIDEDDEADVESRDVDSLSRYQISLLVRLEVNKGFKMLLQARWQQQVV